MSRTAGIASRKQFHCRIMSHIVARIELRADATGDFIFVQVRMGYSNENDITDEINWI